VDEFKERFNAAKSHRKEYIEAAGREVYKYCFNGREREWDEALTPRDVEGEEIFTDVVATIAEDFYGELFSTMTPENAPWVEYEAGNGVTEEQVQDAEGQLGDFEGVISKAIRASNYYDEGATAFQDAVVGTVAAWVEKPTLSGPISVRALPISKCFLRLGPRGLEDRFFRERYYYRDLPALLQGATFSKDLQDKIKNARGSAIVVWGFWRDYSDVSNPIWKQAIRVDGKPVGLDVDLGAEGNCPMIVGRFNPVPSSAWGRGPGLRMLPTMRVLDEIVRMNMEGMDRNLDPPFVYAHDGLLDLSNGLENGMAYPSMPGSTDSVQALGLGGDLDYGFFSEERLTESLRDGFYRDVPQKGKTPPSASQYMGEEQKQVRRMARPAAKLWREFGVGLLKRVEMLEREPGGMLEGQEFPLLDSGAVIARPISPLERAQAREDVLVAQSIMGMTQEGLGPEQAGLLIDGPTTFRAIKAKLKDNLVSFRSEEKIMQMMQAMQEMQQNVSPPPEG
jgi:hypothetical protein